MKILLSIYSFGFYHRLRWMLQSVKELSYKVDTNVSIYSGDPYYDDKVISYNNGVKFKKYDDMELFSQRHNCRDSDLKGASGYDYICFMDSDIVFDKDFFTELLTNTLDSSRLINVPRDTFKCPIKEMDSKVREGQPTNVCDYLKDTFGPLKSGTCIGGGYFQMVSVGYCADKNIEYSGKDRPINSKDGQKAYSDKQFRNRFSGVQKIRNMSNRIYHLHHEKGNYSEVGAR